MGRAVGLIGVLIAVCVGFYLYTKQAQSVTPTGAGSPKAAIDLTGVKNDLINIAKAEKGHFATDGKYLTFEELTSSGDLSMSASNRGGYTYSIEVGGNSFKVVATYGGTVEGYPKTMWCDDSMTVHQE